MAEIKESLNMYCVEVDRHTDDASENDPKMKFGTSWTFKDMDSLEAWSLTMIPFSNNLSIAFKYRKTPLFLTFSTQEKVKDLEFLSEDIVQIKCMTSGPLVNTADEYHFTILMPSRTVPFTLSNLLRSLENTDYAGDIREIEERGRDFFDSTGNMSYGKRLCSKVNILLRDFDMIKVKLESQRAMASARSVGINPSRAEPGSQGSVETIGQTPSTSRRKSGKQQSVTGKGKSRGSNLNPANASRRASGASQASEVEHPSVKEAMTQIPSSYNARTTPDYKQITAVYKKFWEEC